MKIKDMLSRSQRLTSKSNDRVVSAASLAEKKYRAEAKMFLCEGLKLTEEALVSGVDVKMLFVGDSLASSEFELPEPPDGCAVYSVPDGVLAKISTEKAPQGIIAAVGFCAIHDLTVNCIRADEKIIALEDVRDPGNLGTIVRSAAAFGVRLIVLCGDCADLYNPRTLRASMGALFKTAAVRSDVAGLSRTLHRNGRRLLAALPHEHAFALGRAGNTINNSDCPIIGNEGHGLSDEAVRRSDGCLYIPMEPGAESLNAAVAASVVMWEMYRGG